MNRKLFTALAALLMQTACAVAAGTIADAPATRTVLAGDYPDPSIVKVGQDYYMTHSPFTYKPGFLIWHSRDLAHWQPVGRAVPDYRGSAMAPDLVYYGGKYYLYFPSAGTNFVVWATDPRGPWSEPVDLKIGGIDPGHVADSEGHRWLYTNDGHVTPLTPDGLARAGKTEKVYSGWDYPKKWRTEGKYLESPKLTYHNGWYYMTSAEGGTAGPKTSHMAICARSKSPLGPWENSPYNPVVRTYSANEPWASTGHGTIVEGPDGRWWIVYHGYRSSDYTLGRSTLMAPIRWTSDGWYTLDTERPKLDIADDHEAARPSISDGFIGDKLGWQWTLWRDWEPQSVSVGGGKLTLRARGANVSEGRLLLTTAYDSNYTIEAQVEPRGGAEAGLLLFYNEKAFAGLTVSGSRLTLHLADGSARTYKNAYGRQPRLRLHNRCGQMQAYASKDGRQWSKIGGFIDVSAFHHNQHKGFLALRPALVAAGKGSADFRDFIYKDAVPGEADVSAYLMVYHSDADHGLHMALSRDGHTFTSLRDSLPVIAGDTIASQHGIRDPHIMRGPDGAFYMAMTDLHIYAQREGYRQTEWERDGRKYGWGNNRNLVLMKSFDLKHWQRTLLHVDSLSREFGEIGCAWAPETIYDEAAGRLMLYWTMRFGNGLNRLYWAYVSDDYTHLTSQPRVLFEYPDGSSAAIDGDITRYGSKYYLMYVSHESTSGIKMAEGDTPQGPWRFSPRWIDAEPNSCEAPTVWKRIGEDCWVLMTDCFGLKKHNFSFMETHDFKTFTPIGRFNEGCMKTTNFSSPKHGAVVWLTAAEADALEAE